MTVDLATQYPALLKRYGLNADGSGTAIPSLIDECVKAKAGLRAMLRMPEDGRLHFKVNPTEESFKKSMAFMQVLARDDPKLLEDLKNFPAVLENKRPDGSRYSRALLKASNETRKLAAGFFNQDSDAFRRELPKLPIRKADVKGVEVIIQNIFSELAVAGIKGVLSANFFDIMNCSNHAAIRSCFGIDGAYESAPVCINRTPNALVLLAMKEDKVTGRCFVIFNDNLTEVIFQQPYGFFNTELLDEVAKYVVSVLPYNKDAWARNTEYNARHGMRKDTANYAANGANTIFIDNDAQFLLYNKAAGGTEHGFIMKFATPKCLLCGKEHNDARLVCRGCRDAHFSYCNVCGRSFPKTMEGAVRHQYGTVCPTCMEGCSKACHKCGEREFKHAREYGLGAHVCTTAAKVVKKAPICLYCQKHVDAVEMVGPVAICKDCLAAVRAANQCHACKTNKGPFLVFEGKAYCATCAPAMLLKDKLDDLRRRINEEAALDARRRERNRAAVETVQAHAVDAPVPPPLARVAWDMWGNDPVQLVEGEVPRVPAFAMAA